MRARTLALLSLLVVVLADGVAAGQSSSDSRHGGSGSWLAFGRGAQLTNFAPSLSIDARNASTLAVAWSARLDGAVIAQPLLLHVYGRGLVIAATEGGSVYALDSVTGAVVWRRTFATVATPGCGTYGFSSTGAVDLDRGLVYVAGADGLVHALPLLGGAEPAGWPIRVIRRTAYTYVWGGLRIVGSRLYVPVASYCDEFDARGLTAEGRILAIDLDDTSSPDVFDPVPGFGNLGGDWAWGGVSAEPDGRTSTRGSATRSSAIRRVAASTRARATATAW